MQVHNALRRPVDLLQGVRKALGQDPEPNFGIERLGETLTPTLDIWQLPEWSYLRGEKLFTGRQQQAAVAGELACITIANESADYLMVIERIQVWVSAGCTVLFGYDNIPAGAVLTNQSRTLRDNRWPTPAALGNQLNLYADTHAAAVLTSNTRSLIFDASGTQTLDLEWVITPAAFTGTPVATKLLVEQQTANLILSINVDGRMRRMFDSERPDR